MLSKIIVTLDGSRPAENVLPHARALAHHLSVPVDLISVIDLIEMARSVSATEGLFLDKFAEDEGRIRGAYLDTVAKTFSLGRVQCRVLRGNPENVIIESTAVDKEALIAMATHGRSGVNRWLLGSVAEKVLRGTSNPLLLVRAAEGAPTEGEAALGSIMVPLDGSELAETVLPLATDLAKNLNIGLVLFRAYNIPGGFYDVGGGFAVDLDRLLVQVEVEVQQYLEEISVRLRKAGVAHVTIASRQGFGADEIIGYARNAPDCLIAMSSHGRSGVRRWALGSVTETVVRHVNNPVLIFRASI